MNRSGLPAPAAHPTAPRRSRIRSPLAGLGHMVVTNLRTGWPPLLAATGLPVALVVVMSASIASLYPDLSQRQEYAATMGTSVPTIAFNGHGYGLTTLGGITAYEVGFMGQLFFPLFGALLAIRLTRREEEAGRIELITALPVGRLTPLSAASLLLVGTAAITAALMAAGMIATGLPVAGSVWYAAGAGECILFFAALGLIACELCRQASTARTLCLVALTLAFLSRFAIDAARANAAWASPLGWLPQIRAFDDSTGPRAWPLIAYAAGTVLLWLAAVAIASRRDLGSGLIAPRPGPARGGARRVGGWRLSLAGARSSALTWGLLASTWAVIIGLLSEEMTRLINANPALLRAMGIDRGSDLTIMMACIIMVSAAGAAAVQGATHLAAEETEGRLGALLSTATPRIRLWAGWWAARIALALAIVGWSVLLLGATTCWTTGESASLTAALRSGASYAAPVLLVAAVAAALGAISPRLAPLAWIVVVWMVVVGFLAEALRLPEWARDLSFAHMVGVLPVDEPSTGIIAAQWAAAAVLLAAAAALFAARDLRAG